jgi:hypothetical protein
MRLADPGLERGGGSKLGLVDGLLERVAANSLGDLLQLGGAASAKAFNLAYSDAGLFGISVSAPTNEVADIATKSTSERAAPLNARTSWSRSTRAEAGTRTSPP